MRGLGSLASMMAVSVETCSQAHVCTPTRQLCPEMKVTQVVDARERDIASIELKYFGPDSKTNVNGELGDVFCRWAATVKG